LGIGHLARTGSTRFCRVEGLHDALLSAIKKDAVGFGQCFPEYVEFINKHDAFLIEYDRQAEAAAAEAKQREVQRKSPHGQVLEGYTLYRLVRYCNEVRRDYLLQFINDVELGRATTAIQGVVRKAKQDEPAIDTDKIWDESAAAANGEPVSAEICQRYLQQLLRMSPVAVYQQDKPPD
jgi:hypothetical protein